MDRRMLLAFVLAMGVVFLNSILFSPSEPEHPATEAIDSLSVAAETVASAEPAPREREPLQAFGTLLQDQTDDEVSLDPVVVETDLVEARFDPLGGTLRSWKLKRYTDANEEPADLVRTEELGALWLALRSPTGVVRTDSTRFRTTVDRNPRGTEIRFTAEDPTGLQLEKIFFIPNDRYDCELEIRVDGVGDGSYEIGWVDGLPLLEKDPKYEIAAVSAVALFGKNYERVGGRGSFGCASGGGGAKSETKEGTLKWFGVRNKYFLGALVLDEALDRKVVLAVDGEKHEASAFMSEPLEYSGPTERKYRLYLGPIHYGTLSSYGVQLERVQDLGPGILRPFSKLLMKFFEALNRIIPNYGFLILILSILIRIVFYPLTKKSMQSMKRMQELKPEIERINEKYKDDAERKNREMMELYRKKKINPLGGCLPMVIQLPVLSGLYYVLSNAIQLRKEPFIFWIKDLSAPDTVAHVAGFPVNPMPLIMAITMIWQQRMTPTDPRQRTIGYMMPIFMTFLFYSMSSGLVFYWTTINVMTVLQQAWMNRGTKTKGVDDQDEAAPQPRKKGKKG